MLQLHTAPRPALRALALTLTIVFTASLALAAPVVTMVAPKDKDRLRGTVQVVGTITGADGVSYAILYVDSTGRGVTNSQPMRFELDTTNLPNGAHILKIEAYDQAGPIGVSKPVSVTVKNGEKAATAPVTIPAAPKPTTVPSTPKPAATPAPVAPCPVTPPTQVELPPTPKLAVLLDGQPVAFDQDPYIVDGRTMVVLRALIAETGGSLLWDHVSKQAVAKVGDSRLVFTPALNTVLKDGATVALAQPLELKSGRLFIPATAWRDLFNGSVAYDPALRHVMLGSAPGALQADAK